MVNLPTDLREKFPPEWWKVEVRSCWRKPFHFLRDVSLNSSFMTVQKTRLSSPGFAKVISGLLWHSARVSVCPAPKSLGGHRLTGVNAFLLPLWISSCQEKPKTKVNYSFSCSSSLLPCRLKVSPESEGDGDWLSYWLCGVLHFLSEGPLEG